MHGGAGRNGGLDRLGSMFTQGPSMEVGKEGFRKGPAGGNGKAKAEGPGEPPVATTGVRVGQAGRGTRARVKRTWRGARRVFIGAGCGDE